MEKKVYKFISKETNDPIVEWKTCKVSGSEFPIYQSDLQFYDKISPTFNGVKYQIPAPTLCPEEREKRRLTRKNERKFYRRKCDATWENIISLYAPDPVTNRQYTIYNPKVWRSDSRDSMKYGRNFDFTKTFNQQFSDLLHEVPLMAIYIKNSENCEYNNIINDSKNCYLCVSTGYAENTFYTTISAWLNHCYDAYRLIRSENCYEAIDSDSCYECFYIQKCVNCDNCRYMKNCTQCKNCRMCVDINVAEYMILNTQYTQKEYSDMIERLQNDKKMFQDFYQKYQKLQENQPVDNANISAENCIGWFITNSSDCSLCFDTIECKRSKYCSGIGLKVNDCYDCGWWDVFESERCYESCLIPFNNHTMFSYNCRNSNNLYYCFDCYDSSDCFGCIGLRNKQYCILNKQYTKEEYEKELSKIITYMTETGERWEYFSPSISPFGYNETVAQTLFPLEKKDALLWWYHWQDINYDAVVSHGINIVQWKNLSHDISTIQDDILEKIIVCKTSGRPFRITKTELEFYRKYNISLPRKHPDIRHQERIDKRPKRELHLRNCDKCKKEMISVYSQSYSGKVYCEICYNHEVYW